MPKRGRNDYSADWKEVAKKVKDAAGWQCVRCGMPHNKIGGYVLTVHHIDLDKSNNRWWNLAALCQRCHLTIQAKVDIDRPWMFDHSRWFKPYVAGYYAFRAGLPDDKAYVMDNLEELLTTGWTMKAAVADPAA